RGFESALSRAKMRAHLLVPHAARLARRGLTTSTVAASTVAKTTTTHRFKDSHGKQLLEVVMLPALSDNYGFLARCGESSDAFMVDSPDGEKGCQLADELGWKITTILNTHHHFDHVGGNQAVIEHFKDVEVIGPDEPNGDIPGLGRVVSGGDAFSLGGLECQVLDVGGHTHRHVAFHLPQVSVLFAGDAIFPLGCGRLFEGTAEDAFASLQRIAALPAATTIFSAHEYALANAKFALHVDPSNEALARRAAQIEALRGQGLPTVPSVLSEELETNPFLTVPSQPDQDASATPVQRFAHLRALKDNF
ncbi:Hydroxyacylglutathione hydrolase (Glyoxalase II) (Glx II), partial [Durusdinium trenchii]